MLVVRKFNRELALFLCLKSLIRIIRFTESEARSFARSSPRVTDRADCRPGATERLPGKKLLPMTLNTGIVSGKISHIGKVSLGRPGRRNFVTRVAFEALVFSRRMKEAGILCCRSPRGLGLRRSCPRSAASLRGAQNHCASRDNEYENASECHQGALTFGGR